MEKKGNFLIGRAEWLEPVQLRRLSTAGAREGWCELGQVQPLACAVRDALKMLEREPIAIYFVYPRSGMHRLTEVDILDLARRVDYPHRQIDEITQR